jgi:hypothetical protein
MLLHAEEGMWTFNNPPSESLRAKYGFAPDQKWLDHLRLSSVRLTEGCSASLVSPNGLVMTNDHCVATCVQELSTASADYSAKGYHAKSADAERRCPGQEANILDEITDVTPRFAAATRGLSDKEAFAARRAETAKLEKECATGNQLRCEVVSLYGGGIYNLYKYRRYQDVRIVFAPEFQAAFFGGDPDNFMFPRYNLDAAFLRIYENGQPLKTAHWLPFSRSGAKEGELTLVSGHPGGTNRQHTIAMLEFERDFIKPQLLLYLSEQRGLLTMFQTRGEEQRRITQEELVFAENTLKSFKGEWQALLDPGFFAQKRKEEQDFQSRIHADAKLKAEFGGVWDEVSQAVKQQRVQYLPYLYFERSLGFRSDLYRHARRLLRMSEEYAKPNEARLEEFTDARKPQLSQATLSPAPIHKELEIETLTFSLTKLREAFSVDDPRIRRIFGKRSPREIATEVVNGTRLQDVAVRKALLEGGGKAVAASQDPMIALAKQVDPIARAIRKKYEDEVESVLTTAREKLAKARFAAFGLSLYPDATFTLRLSYGQVKGWMENGSPVNPFTVIEGAFERATGRDPYALPQSWLDARSRLNLQTRLNFVTTNDIIGGNSGSPAVNRQAELVGLIFDGNIHSLGGNYGFDEVSNRAVAVHSDAILESLDKIYGAKRLLGELTRK